MEINCLHCGHRVHLDDAYDDYEGEIKCWVCGALVEIRAEQGSLKAMRLAASGPRSSPEEAVERAP